MVPLACLQPFQGSILGPFWAQIDSLIGAPSNLIIALFIAIGGPFIANWGWDVITRPKLWVDGAELTERDIRNITIRNDIPVKNIGKRGAYNCTVELWFYGSIDDKSEDKIQLLRENDSIDFVREKRDGENFQQGLFFRMLTPLGWVDQYRDVEHYPQELDLRSDILSERVRHVCLGYADRLGFEFTIPEVSGLEEKKRYKLIQIPLSDNRGRIEDLKERYLYFNEDELGIVASDQDDLRRPIPLQYLEEGYIETALLTLQADNAKTVEYTISFENYPDEITIRRNSRLGRLLDMIRCWRY